MGVACIAQLQLRVLNVRMEEKQSITLNNINQNLVESEADSNVNGIITIRLSKT